MVMKGCYEVGWMQYSYATQRHRCERSVRLCTKICGDDGKVASGARVGMRMRMQMPMPMGQARQD